MRSGLTWDQAARWEILYISRYGRKDLGIGILRNLTDGGEGTLGRKVHASSRAKMSAAMKGRTFSAEHRAKISAAKQDMSAEQRAKISAANQGRVLSAETRARMSAARKGRAFSEEHLAKIKAAKQGRGAEIGAKISAAKAAQRAFTAKKFGISPEIYEKLTPAQRKTLGNRHRRGKRGAALLEGLL
jgi:Spy/CpxP family protein refolding chaperone